MLSPYQPSLLVARRGFDADPRRQKLETAQLERNETTLHYKVARRRGYSPPMTVVHFRTRHEVTRPLAT